MTGPVAEFPRVWHLPPEPGREVQSIACLCHGRWDRYEWPSGVKWHLATPAPGPYTLHWRDLYLHLPLTEVSDGS